MNIKQIPTEMLNAVTGGLFGRQQTVDPKILKEIEDSCHMPIATVKSLQDYSGVELPCFTNVKNAHGIL